MMTFRSQLQKGFSIITAIFLLVVLGTLGTMMMTFFVAQQQSSALDVMGSRAYQAARAGIEWAAYQVAQQPTGSQWTGCTNLYATTTTKFSAGDLSGTLSPFKVSLLCSSVAGQESSKIYVYNITSTASYGGAAGDQNYIERVISVKMGR